MHETFMYASEIIECLQVKLSKTLVFIFNFCSPVSTGQHCDPSRFAFCFLSFECETVFRAHCIPDLEYMQTNECAKPSCSFVFASALSLISLHGPSAEKMLHATMLLTLTDSLTDYKCLTISMYFLAILLKFSYIIKQKIGISLSQHFFFFFFWRYLHRSTQYCSLGTQIARTPKHKHCIRVTVGRGRVM